MFFGERFKEKKKNVGIETLFSKRQPMKTIFFNSFESFRMKA